MTAAKRAAAPKKGAAARAERNGRKKLDFHGVKLTLPPKLPNSFAMRFARIVALEEKGEMAVDKVYDLLVPKYVSEEQYDQLLDAVDETPEEVGLVDLVMAIGNSYGADPGESEASESS